MNRKYNVVELFSGIGSQTRALRNLGVDVNTVGTCEWDVHAIVAYDVIHNDPIIPDDIDAMSKDELLDVLKNYTFSNSGKEKLEYQSLRTYSETALKRIYMSLIRNKNFVDIKSACGSDIPKGVDIMTYSFPCQDLSNVGAFHGYNKGIDKGSGSRSSLLWQVGRILTEMREEGTPLPKFLLMENVPALLSERHKANFEMWISDLAELGYVSQYYPLNALDFGLPQNRPRLLMISVYVGENKLLGKCVKEYFKVKDSRTIVKDYRSLPQFKDIPVQSFLRTNYKNKKIYEEALDATPNDTISRRKIWDENPQIVQEGNVFNESVKFIRTITTKQDRNPNSGNLYWDSGVEGKSKFRYLTPRECLLFMGFTDEDYRRLKDNNVEFHKGDAFFSRDKILRMAGNSIPVKLLEGIFLQILQINDLIDELHRHEQGCAVSREKAGSFSQKLRSSVYSMGVRSRINNDAYPHEANIIYQKYRTAIFFVDSFWNSTMFADASSPTSTNTDVWDKLVCNETSALKERIKTATDMGWNVILVSDRDPITSQNFLEWFVEKLRGNLDSGCEPGKVFAYGGCQNN